MQTLKAAIIFAWENVFLKFFPQGKIVSAGY
jgi:hypothetical protein